MSGWLCFCFLQDPIHSLNSSAHKLPFLLRARPSLWGVSCGLFCLVFWVIFGFVLLVFWAAGFALWLAPQVGLVGPRTGPGSLLTPQ